MKAWHSLGYDYLYISADSSAMYLSRAINLARRLGNKRIESGGYSMLGVLEKNRGNYDKAISYHLSSLRISEEQKDEHSMAISYNDLGVLYKTIRQYDAALDYYRKSNELCQKIKLYKGVSMTYNNIGTIMKARDLHDSALHYYTLGLRTAEQTGDTYSISTCLSNVGETYLTAKRYSEALNIFKKCLQFDKLNEDKEGMVNSYLQICLALNRLGNNDQSLRYSDSAYHLCEQERLLTLMLDVFKIQAEVYKSTGNHKAALAVMERFIATRDTLMDKETSQHIADYQTRYETEKKEKEIITLRQQQEINELTLSRQELRLQKTRYQMLAIVGIVLLGVIVTYLLYNRQLVKQKQAREKAVIAAEYNERLRIAKDVHDDLGSGLSKISLMADIAQKRSANSLKLSNDIQYISTVSKELTEKLSSMAISGQAIIDRPAGQINDISQGLTNISATAQMARQEAISSATIGNDIRHIATISKELVDNMRDLIWVLNPENTTLDNLVARMREYCADYLDGMQVEFSLDFPHHIPDMRISREAQRNIFSTVKESINNCVKHASAKEINITLKIDDRRMTIAVQDNGKGFEMTNLKGSGNGLRNMRQRIEAIGGTFIITSASHTGTTVNIDIPLAHLDLLKNTTIV